VPFPDALSDEKDSAIDERLAGVWLIDNHEFVVTPNDRETEFIVTGPPVDAPDPIDVLPWGEPGNIPFGPDESFTVRMTQIGKTDYFSIPVRRGPKDVIQWLIFRYQVESDDEVHVFAMDAGHVAQAVKEGQLPAKMRKPRPGPMLALIGAPRNAEVVEVTSSRDDLRVYLSKHSEQCFELRPTYILKRKARATAKSSGK
jgi:hypothetical protein